jgi:inosine/xanthosine triphosphatase
MKTIIVASTNPAKIDGFRLAFTRMFPDDIFDFQSVKANSDVSDQPWGRDETLRGAKNRILHARTLAPTADYWVTNESGVEEIETDLFIVNVVAITDGTTFSNTLTASFQLPPRVADYVRSCMEVTQGFEAVFGPSAAKDGIAGIGHLSGGNIPRAELIAMGAITALIPFRNPNLYIQETVTPAQALAQQSKLKSM